ncbi:MAG: tetratricopeptide repeat protein, partial [Actinocatenispora sp.]
TDPTTPPAGPATTLLVTVDGAAGVGKTALALQWAHRVRDRFPDGQLYVNLHGYGPGAPADPGVVLVQFLGALGVPAEEVPTDVEARAGLLRSTLAGRRILLVLDNARSAGQVRPLLPGDPACVVLVTSRNQLGGLSVRDGAHRVSLDRLDDAESTALLARFVGAERLAAEPAAVAGIVRQCAGLPLALSLVGDLATRERTLPEAAAELADHRTRLEVLADEDEATSVRAVFSWSYRTLDPEVARLFRLLALHPGPDLDLPAATALAGLPVPHTRRLVATLTGGHLLEQRRPGRYEFHDLLRVYARDLADRHESDPDRRAAVTRLLDHYLRVAVAAARALDPGGGVVPGGLAAASDVTFPDQAGALAWLNTERPNLLAATAVAATEGRPSFASDLSDTLWRYLHQAAFHGDALTVHGEALAVARAAGDEIRQSRALFGLGTVNDRLGHTDEAIAQLVHAAALSEANGDHFGNAQARNYLGLIHTATGDAALALRDHERALELYRHADNQVGEGSSLNNLGLVCRRLDRTEDALRHFQQAQAITRRVGDRATEGGATNNIGLILRRLGRYEDALRHFRDALEIAREIGHREGEGFAASNVGSACAALGRYAEAREHQRTALRLGHQIGMPALQGKALNQLGRIDELTGDNAAAAERYREALRVSAGIGARYEQAIALDGLGAATAGLGRPDEARRYWREALALYTELDSPTADDVRRRLAGCPDGS